jgi:hypothetical protein
VPCKQGWLPNGPEPNAIEGEEGQSLPHPESQINAGNHRIASLEEKLRDANEDCHFVRNQLFDTEIAQRNEARVAFQRHDDSNKPYILIVLRPI